MSSTTPSTSTTAATTTIPVNRHALTAVEKQRSQLDKLLKDPAKPAYIPPPPKEKTIRAAREMMKNVQGSSAGAGSGEFHVYKASRRREYERLKLLEEASHKVWIIRIFLWNPIFFFFWPIHSLNAPLLLINPPQGN
jgi:Protein of unknown function (DUF1168)